MPRAPCSPSPWRRGGRRTYSPAARSTSGTGRGRDQAGDGRCWTGRARAVRPRPRPRCTWKTSGGPPGDESARTRSTAISLSRHQVGDEADDQGRFAPDRLGRRSGDDEVPAIGIAQHGKDAAAELRHVPDGEPHGLFRLAGLRHARRRTRFSTASGASARAVAGTKRRPASGPPQRQPTSAPPLASPR